MERGVTYRSLIEYFLLMQNGGNRNTLIYYDQQGTRFEKEIERGQIEHALKKFDGKPKAVVRSSGGIVRAIPYQLVLCEGTPVFGQVTPQPKIRVKFRELGRDEHGRIIPGVINTVSKLVEPEQVIELFSYRLENPQRFVVDMGRGIIPIYVFRYWTDPQQRVQALFVELDDMESAVMGSREGKRTLIQPYYVPRDILRYACRSNSYGRDEYDIAWENYRLQKESGKPIFPETLRFGNQIEGTTNLTCEELRLLLTKEVSRLSRLQDEKERLVPFNEK